jgi:hypothetical protein
VLVFGTVIAHGGLDFLLSCSWLVIVSAFDSGGSIVVIVRLPKYGSYILA